jgi:hypothetical protein
MSKKSRSNTGNAPPLRVITYLVFAVGCTIQGFVPIVKAEPVSAPNVVLVTADDLGLHLGYYGDRTVPTPNIDALAEDGVLFENAYATSALCSPSRSTFLTGLYPHQSGQVGLANEYSMRPGIPNLTTFLGQAGYYTALFGKLHVRPAADFHFDAHYAKKFQLDTLDVEKMAEQVTGVIRKAGQRPVFLYINYFDPHRNPSAPDGRKFFDRYKGYPEETVSPEQMAPRVLSPGRSSAVTSAPITCARFRKSDQPGMRKSSPTLRPLRKTSATPSAVHCNVARRTRPGTAKELRRYGQSGSPLVARRRSPIHRALPGSLSVFCIKLIGRPPLYHGPDAWGYKFVESRGVAAPHLTGHGPVGMHLVAAPRGQSAIQA